MPIPIGAAIGAGGSIISQGINAYFTGRQNKKAREWNERMYKMQRADALADWNMQNAYDAPAAQMQRYKDAGLNPNLIYGQSNEGAVVRSANVDSWRPEAPQFDLGAVMANYQNIKLQDAQIAGVEAATKTQQVEQILKMAQAVATTAGTERTRTDTESARFDLALKNTLRDTTIEMAEANLKKVESETAFTLNSDERAAAQNSMSLREAAERILKLRSERAKTEDERREIQARINNLDKDGQLKQMDIELRKIGVNPSDNYFFRILGRILANQLKSGDASSSPGKGPVPQSFSPESWKR